MTTQINPTVAYWNAVKTLKSFKSATCRQVFRSIVNRLNEERFAFERHMPILKFVETYAAMGVVSDLDEIKRQVENGYTPFVEIETHCMLSMEKATA